MTQTRNILNMLGQRRRALAMPYDELQRRSGVSTSTLKRVLRGEVTVSFATVASVADSLGVDLGTTHAQDVTAMRERQARVKARKLIALVQGTSALEGQAVDESDRRLMEQKTAAQLLAGSGLKLWGR